jgi:hypothetical protein
MGGDNINGDVLSQDFSLSIYLCNDGLLCHSYTDSFFIDMKVVDLLSISLFQHLTYNMILLCLFTHFAGARREIVIRPKSNALDYLGAYFHRLCLFRL